MHCVDNGNELQAPHFLPLLTASVQHNFHCDNSYSFVKIDFSSKINFYPFVHNVLVYQEKMCKAMLDFFSSMHSMMVVGLLSTREWLLKTEINTVRVCT